MSSEDTASSSGDTKPCVPYICQTAGGNRCGKFPNGCGGLVDCGNDCPMGQTCSADHLCVADSTCKPTPCSGPGYQFCGLIGDGCNHALNCPDCTSPKMCATNHVCQ
jgi:hypothetical protein